MRLIMMGLDAGVDVLCRANHLRSKREFPGLLTNFLDEYRSFCLQRWTSMQVSCEHMMNLPSFAVETMMSSRQLSPDAMSFREQMFRTAYSVGRYIYTIVIEEIVTTQVLHDPLRPNVQGRVSIDVQFHKQKNTGDLLRTPPPWRIFMRWLALLERFPSKQRVDRTPIRAIRDHKRGQTVVPRLQPDSRCQARPARRKTRMRQCDASDRSFFSFSPSVIRSVKII